MPEMMKVKLLGVDCGELTRTDSGNINFQYHAGYGTDSTPVSLAMPVGFTPYPKYRVLPFIRGLLPDNPNALKALGLRFDVDPGDPFELLKHIGSEVAGALEFVSDKSPESYPSEPLDESAIAKRLNAKLDEYRAGRSAENFIDRLSLAGAQPKLILNFDGESWRLPGEGVISTHIIKPVPEAWRNLDVIEHQTLLAAKRLGLKTARSEIKVFDGVEAFVTERFDRRVLDGVTRRVHQEDLCQALSVSPDKKYQFEGGPSIRKVAKLLNSLPVENDRQTAAEAFYKQLVFNVFARCSDAHAKNYSLVLEGSNVTISPLYDAASTVLYPLPQESAMSIDGEYEFMKITEAGLIAEAKTLVLDQDWAAEVINKTKSAMLDAFSDAAKEINSGFQRDSVKLTTAVLIERLKESLK